MERTKRCFICGAKEDKDGHCTNAECPRYVTPSISTNNTSTTTVAAS
jgi:hypothetical protein